MFASLCLLPVLRLGFPALCPELLAARQYNRTMNDSFETDVAPSRVLVVGIYVALGVLCALGIGGMAGAAAQVTALALCGAFFLLYVFWFRRAHTARQVALYLFGQALVICGLLALPSRTDDLFMVLFFLLAVRAGTLYTAKRLAAWVGGFFLASSGILLCANGLGTLPALVLNAALFFFAAMFGHTLQQATRNSQRNAQLLGELRATQQQLHKLAVSEERNRLARDLHDSVKQQVFATTMRLGAALATLPPDAPAFPHIAAAERMAQQAGEELTVLIRALRPAPLERRGLAQALRAYVADWSGQHGIVAETRVEGGRPLTPAAEDALFRLAQEALANVARHSGATHVHVDLQFGPQNVALTIRDDGRGFVRASVARGLGLQSMVERLAAIGGSVWIDGAASPGTLVEASVPC